MPRERPELTLITVPKIAREQPLSQMHDWAGLLGFSKLANEDAEDLAHFVALARVTPSAVVGLTRRRGIAQLKRWAKKLRHEQRTGVRNEYLRRLMTDPSLGLDTVTFLRLAPLVAAPASELAAAVETRTRELELEPDTDPQHEALVSAGGVALLFFLVCAANSVRDEPGAWWRFALAFLDAAGLPTDGLYQHPERLRPLLDELRAAVEPQAKAVRAALPFLRLYWRSRP
jgi:hypothetical protein